MFTFRTSIMLLVLLPVYLNAQQEGSGYRKNSLFVQANLHLEKRGSDQYDSSNPDFAISYERKWFKFGSSRILSGIRTGAYDEYVLTGNGWEHPVKTRFFWVHRHLI